jgi:TonB family protein
MMNKIIRYLTSYLILAAVLLMTISLSGCSGLLSNFIKEYRCTIMGKPEPVTAEDYYLRAIDHAELSGTNTTGDFDECAMAALNESLRLDPNHVKALRMRGYGYYYKKKYDLALADIEKSIQLEPNNSFGYSLRARIFESTGLIDNAIADQTKAIELAPKENTELHYYFARRGDYYLRKGDYELAAADYTEAIRLKPDYKYHYSDRAKAYRQLGKNDLAEADEQKAEKIEPSQTPTNSAPLKSITGGRLNDKAVNLVKPAYPPAAKAVRASGSVIVRVSIDEQGNVDSARTVSGHPLLRASAEAAAMASKFSPTMYNGKAVRVTGTVLFDFIPE